MKFSYNGHWTSKLETTLSDKIRKAFENFVNKLFNKGTTAEEVEPKLFGNAVINSEINWELTAEMSLDEFKELAKSAREDDDHLLEWMKNYGKSLISGAKQTITAAKELLPEIKNLKKENWMVEEEIRHEHALKYAQNMHDEKIHNEKLSREYAEFISNEKKTKKETATNRD